MMMWEGFEGSVVLASDIQPLAKMMESPHLKNDHTAFQIENAQITDMTQNAVHSGFMKHTSNKLKNCGNAQ